MPGRIGTTLPSRSPTRMVACGLHPRHLGPFLAKGVSRKDIAGCMRMQIRGAQALTVCSIAELPKFAK
jgi:hypothetical protein